MNDPNKPDTPLSAEEIRLTTVQYAVADFPLPNGAAALIIRDPTEPVPTTLVFQRSSMSDELERIVADRIAEEFSKQVKVAARVIIPIAPPAKAYTRLQQPANVIELRSEKSGIADKILRAEDTSRFKTIRDVGRVTLVDGSLLGRR